MTMKTSDQRITRLNSLSDRLFGDGSDLEPGEAEELLKASGIDPDRLNGNLYQRMLERSRKYSDVGQPLPPLMRQALDDLNPASEKGELEGALVREAKLVIARMLQKIREMRTPLDPGMIPAFTAAYRNRKELSSRDVAVLDGVAEELGKRLGVGSRLENRQDGASDEPAGRRSSEGELEKRGPAYARALLAELPGEPGGVREIASTLQLHLQEVEADGFEGALIRAANLPVGAIALRASSRDSGRMNFTIAHEIGHFVLPGHDQASLACTAFDVANWADASRGRELEREADEFAAELLMPASLVEGLSQGVSPSLHVIEKIARKAGASLSAAAWRYCDLASEKCAVVWSTDGVIQWVKRTRGFSYFLPKGKPIENGTFAAACFEKAKVPSRPRVVPPELWIGATDKDSSLRLLEQSKALPSYRSAISLLWIEDRQPGRADE
jgi:hypothetical protein